MLRLSIDISNTPVGVVAAVCRGGKVVAVEVGASTAQEATYSMARRLGQPEFDLAENAAGRQLREYFAGKRRSFTLKWDLSGMPPFQARALEVCAGVPFGRVATYGDIARAAGSPGASRAVGQAMKNNPIAIIIPCHRVTGTRSLGGYSSPGGTAAKLALLRFEGVDLARIDSRSR